MPLPAVTLRQKQLQQRTAREKVDRLNAKAGKLLGRDYAGALALAAQAEMLAEKCSHVRGSVTSLALQSSCHSELARNGEALGCAMRALRLSRDPAAADLTADCLHRIGIQFNLAGDYRNAQKYLGRMETLCRKRADHPGQGTALCMIGATRLYQGEPRAARDAYAEALALARREKLHELEARALMNLGIYHHGKGDNAGAIERLRLSLKLFSKLGNTGWVMLVQTNLGALYTETGDLTAARAVLRASLRHTRSSGGARVQSATLTNLSELDRRSGRPAAAVKLARRALKMAQRNGDRRQEIFTLEALGKAERDLGESAAARRHFQAALQRAQAAGDREALQSVRRALREVPPVK